MLEGQEKISYERQVRKVGRRISSPALNGTEMILPSPALRSPKRHESSNLVAATAGCAVLLSPQVGMTEQQSIYETMRMLNRTDRKREDWDTADEMRGEWNGRRAPKVPRLHLEIVQHRRSEADLCLHIRAPVGPDNNGRESRVPKHKGSRLAVPSYKILGETQGQQRPPSAKLGHVRHVVVRTGSRSKFAAGAC